MNKEETRKAIEAVLPRGWTLDYLDMKNRSFQVTCPISDRFEVPDATFIGNVERIAMAADGEYDGSAGDRPGNLSPLPNAAQANAENASGRKVRKRS